MGGQSLASRRQPYDPDARPSRSQRSLNQRVDGLSRRTTRRANDLERVIGVRARECETPAARREGPFAAATSPRAGLLPGLTTSSWGLSLSLGPGGVLLRLLLSGVLLRLLLGGVLLRLLLGGALLRLLLGGVLLRLLLGGALLRLLLGGVLLCLLLGGALLRLLLGGALLRLLPGGTLLCLLLGRALLRLLLGGALLRLLLNSLPRRRRMRRRYLPSRRWGRMCCRRGCARCRLRRPLGYRRLSLGFPGGSKV